MSDESRPNWYLKAWLKYLGRKPQWLAEQTGLDKSQISRLASGKYTWNHHHRDLFARTLGIEPWWLSDIDPFDPHSELELLKAIRGLPGEKRGDVQAMINAIAARRAPAASPHAPSSSRPKKS